MSKLVESLRRLYKAGSKTVTEERLIQMIEKGSITEEEYEYIIAE